MPTAGLACAFTSPKAPLSEQDYNEWYSEYHIQDVVHAGLATLAVRYKNKNPNAAWPYLAVYHLPDIAKLRDQEFMASIPHTHALLPDGKPWPEALNHDIRSFTVIQEFEGPTPMEGM